MYLQHFDLSSSEPCSVFSVDHKNPGTSLLEPVKPPIAISVYIPPEKPLDTQQSQACHPAGNKPYGPAVRRQVDLLGSVALPHLRAHRQTYCCGLKAVLKHAGPSARIEKPTRRPALHLLQVRGLCGSGSFSDSKGRRCNSALAILNLK